MGDWWMSTVHLLHRQLSSKRAVSKRPSASHWMFAGMPSDMQLGTELDAHLHGRKVTGLL